MTNLCNIRNPLSRTGTSQRSRFLAALNPDFIKIDEQSTADLLNFACQYAKELNFFNTSDEIEGTWKELIENDISTVLSKIITTDLEQIRGDYSGLIETVNTTATVQGLEDIFLFFAELSALIDDWLGSTIEELSINNKIRGIIGNVLSPSFNRLAAFDLGAAELFDGYNFDPQRYTNLSSFWNVNLDQITPDTSIYIGNVDQVKIPNGVNDLSFAFDELNQSIFIIINDSPACLERTLSDFPSHQPHVGLFLAFLEMLSRAREDLNEITERHLEFYYNDVLRLTRNQAVADQVHIVFELARNVDATSIAKGTLLAAGTDALGNDVVFETDRDISLNRAAIKEIKTVFSERDQSNEIIRVFASPGANTVGGLGEEPLEDMQVFSLFGEAQSTRTDIERTMPSAQLGFAISSPLLLLRSGQRTIKVALEFSGDTDEIFRANLRNSINVKLTGEEELITKRLSSVTTELGPLEFTITLTQDDPAIIAYDPELHGNNFDTTDPLIQFELTDEFLRVEDLRPEGDAVIQEWDRRSAYEQDNTDLAQVDQGALVVLESEDNIFVLDDEGNKIDEIIGNRGTVYRSIRGGIGEEAEQNINRKPGTPGAFTFWDPISDLSSLDRALPYDPETIYSTTDSDSRENLAIANFADETGIEVPSVQAIYRALREGLTGDEGSPINSNGELVSDNWEFLIRVDEFENEISIWDSAISYAGPTIDTDRWQRFETTDEIVDSEADFFGNFDSSRDIIVGEQVIGPDGFLYEAAVSRNVTRNINDPLDILVPIPTPGTILGTTVWRLAGERFYAYEFLNDVIVSGRIDLNVDVKGISELVLASESGRLDIARPFTPFSSRPDINSQFFLGSQEIFQKQLDSLDINITWDLLPIDTTGFAGYYSSYFEPVDNPSPSQVISNTDFTVNIEVLDNGVWIPIKVGNDIGRFNLFSDNSNIADGRLELNQTIALGSSTDNLDSFLRRDNIPNFTDFDRSITNGFIRLVLTRTGSNRNITLPIRAFGHQEFNQLLTTRVIARSLDSNSDAELPNEPYTPTIKELTVNYSSSASFTVDTTSRVSFNSRKERLFHVDSFGQKEVHRQLFQPLREGANDDLTLIPEYNGEGVLYLGLTDIDVPQSVSVLFQLQNGTGDPNFVLPEIEWSILSENNWLQIIPGEGISFDSTNGLINSGTITYDFPNESTTNNTILPSGLFWLRARVLDGADAFDRSLDVIAQAISATFLNQENDPSRVTQGLASETISQKNSQLRRVAQPFMSFGGREEEIDDNFFNRVSERLRHGDRAVTVWDYEHLVLQQFPDIFRVRCLNHTNTVVGLFRRAVGNEAQSDIEIRIANLELEL